MTEKTICTSVELPEAASLPPAKGPAFSDPLSLIGDVKVKLEFVIGETTLSVGDLGKLTAGSAVKLDQDQGSQVSIRLNGADIGFGMLVSVDGAIGVQIKHIER